MTQRAAPRTGSRRVHERPGRQIERTELAWERSAVGLLATAALLLFRHVEPRTGGRIALAVADLTLALLITWLGRRRGRRIRPVRTNPEGGRVVPDAGVEVVVTGLAAVAMAVGTVLVLTRS